MNPELTKCEMCGRIFRRISNTHLNKYHNLSIAEYKQKFPSSPIESQIYLDNLSKALKGENHPLYGKHHSIESKIKMSESQMGPKNHRYGKKLPEWHKQILRQAAYTHAQKRKGKTYEELYGTERAKEIKEKMGNNFSKYWLGKHLPEELKKRLSKLKEGYKPAYSIKKGQYALEKHPNWLGGKSFEPYTSDFNNIFKELIRERDNHVCIICNMLEADCEILYKKKKLNIHHIDYDKKNSFPQNCASLCNKCHSITNYNREHWKTFFQSLLKERYGYEYTQDQKIILDFTKG